ncbi:MAG TPA: tetratricopeptide repeat protein [Candidatus Acidoferrales bacterium]|nr:tetratricopeptide repeat protein [Candidatus Acidoferrales bacterium]
MMRRVGPTIGFVALAAVLALPTQAAAQVQAPGNIQAEHTEGQDQNNSLLTRAQSDLDNQDYEAAAGKYQEYLAGHPQDAQIHFQLGYCYTALQKADLARTEYQKATELNPGFAHAFLNLGLTELSSDPGAAAQAFQQASDLMPGQERPKLLLATALAHSGKTDEAIAQYQAAEAINPNDSQLHRDFGTALLNANHLTDAEKELRAALTLDSQDEETNLMLGRCLLAQKKYDDATAQIDIYLKSKPDDEKARFTLVSALIDAAKYDDALAELGRASQSTQESLPALKLRFDALAGEKRYDEALATLIKAAAIAPQEPDIPAKMAQLYLARKDYSDAARQFLASLKIDSRNTAAMAGLVSAEYSANDYGDALKAIDLLSQLEPLSIQTLFVRADCYDKLGSKSEAADAYDKFLAANTDRNSDMYFAASERSRVLRRELGKKQ